MGTCHISGTSAVVSGAVIVVGANPDLWVSDGDTDQVPFGYAAGSNRDSGVLNLASVALGHGQSIVAQTDLVAYGSTDLGGRRSVVRSLSPPLINSIALEVIENKGLKRAVVPASVGSFGKCFVFNELVFSRRAKWAGDKCRISRLDAHSRTASRGERRARRRLRGGMPVAVGGVCARRGLATPPDRIRTGRIATLEPVRRAKRGTLGSGLEQLQLEPRRVRVGWPQGFRMPRSPPAAAGQCHHRRPQPDRGEPRRHGADGAEPLASLDISNSTRNARQPWLPIYSSLHDWVR